MSKKRTPLCREAHFEVKMYKAPHVRATFGRSDVVSRGRSKGLCPKKMAGVGHLKRICKAAFSLAGAVQETCSSELLGGPGADFLRGVAFWSLRSSGLLRWFCVTGAALRMTWHDFALGPGKTRRTSTWCLCGASGSFDIFWPTTAWIIQSRWYPKSWATGVWVYGRQALQSIRTSSMTLSTSPAELRREKICRGRRHMSIVFWGWQLFVLTAQWWQFAGIICCVRPQRRSASTWQKMWWSTSHLADELAKISQ